jgi:hypothetical protein
VLKVGWKIRHDYSQNVHDNEIDSSFVAKDLTEHVFDGQSEEVKGKHIEEQVHVILVDEA